MVTKWSAQSTLIPTIQVQIPLKPQRNSYKPGLFFKRIACVRTFNERINSTKEQTLQSFKEPGLGSISKPRSRKGIGAPRTILIKLELEFFAELLSSPKKFGGLRFNRIFSAWSLFEFKGSEMQRWFGFLQPISQYTSPIDRLDSRFYLP